MRLSVALAIVFAFALTQSTYAQTNSSDLKRASNQPFFIPGAPDLAEADWTTILQYYAAFFFIPAVLGFVFSTILGAMNCLSCCCPKCCCAAPCCFNNKCSLFILYSMFVAFIVIGSIIAWQAAPKVTKGVDIVIDLAADGISKIADFFSDAASKLESLGSYISDSILPALGMNSTETANNTNTNSNNTINEASTLVDEIEVLYTQLDKYYEQLTTELGFLSQAQYQPNSVYPYVTPGTVPNASDVPNATNDTRPSIIALKIGLNVAQNESGNFQDQLKSLIPLDNLTSSLSNYFSLPDSIPFLSNFSLPSLPFDLSSLTNTLNPSKLFDFLGISNPLDSLNSTISNALPFDSSTLSGVGKFIDNNGGIYTIVVGGLLAAVCVSFGIWYFGICVKGNICMRVPFTCSALLMTFLGIGIGLHLAFGAVTDNFCVNNKIYILNGANYLKNKTLDANLSESALNATLKILNDPFKVLSCSGNTTLFDLYGIDVLRDFGLNDTLGSFNASSLLSNIPNSSTLQLTSLLQQQDTAFTEMQQNVSYLINITANYYGRNNNNSNDMKQVQNDLDNYITVIPSQQDQVTAYNYSANNITGLIGDITTTLDIINVKLAELSVKIDQIKKDRSSIIDSLLDGISFPNFDMNNVTDFINNIQNNIGSCAWVGTLYNTVIITAICENISPGMLYVGYGTAATALAMFLSFPVIMWSLNL